MVLHWRSARRGVNAHGTSRRPGANPERHPEAPATNQRHPEPPATPERPVFLAVDP